MTEAQPRRYAAPVPVASPGLGPLRFGPTVLLFLAPALALLVTMRAGSAAGMLVLLAAVLLAAPLVARRRGRPLYVAIGNRLRRKAVERSGGTVYRSGLFGVTPDGALRLPGLLARAECRSVPTDGLGRPFALLEYPGSRQWAVVLRVVPEGGALVDPDTHDHRVGEWGQLLATCGQLGRGAALVTATVETQPDDGALLQAHVASLIQPGAPDFARHVLTAAAQELPSGVSSTVGHVAITFTEKSLGIEHSACREARAETAAAEFGRMLPDLSAQLVHAGASTAVPLDAWALTQRIKEAFDPAAVLQHAQLAAAGEPVRIRWEDCGPRAADDLARCYVHDSGASVVFEATRMPRGSITDTVLDTLAGPMRLAPRKRLTLLYRPVPADIAAVVVDRDVKAGINRASRRRGPVHAHDAAALAAAERAAAEEAAGAGVADMSLAVTVTAHTAAGEDLTEAAAAIARAGRSSFRLTRVDGGHAAAFAVGLGIGLDPWSLAVVPAGLRDHL
ncbi:MAG: SCO6880 family protein [Jatrophihabitantaceae bacterium]